MDHLRKPQPKSADKKSTRGFELFVRAAMSTGKAPPPKKAKAKKRKETK
jgi:hypothetical protein